MDTYIVMIDIENENMNQIQPTTNGLGIRLKSAREAMSLSAKEAAAHLHLSVNIINIIEKEQFADGPPPTFMRGYLRSYARFLNVPDHEISKTLKELEMALPIKNTSLPILNTRPIQQTDRYLHWITYLIILTMIGLVALWWHSHQRYIITDVPTKTASPAQSAVPIQTFTPETQSTTDTTQKESTTIANPPSADTMMEDKKSIESAPLDQSKTTETTTTTTSNTITQPTPMVTVPSNTTMPSATPTNEAPLPSAVPSSDGTTSSSTTNTISTTPPPQIDTPPIISATTSPIELNQTDSLATKETPPPTTKHSHRHKSVSRHAPLPGMPGVNMALPEPN
jgi:cytoskeleton protein RodZ